MCWKINKPEIGFSYLMYCISNNICLLFIFRDFYVTVRDNSGVRPELLCGQRDAFTFLAQKLRIDYKSNRYSESWPGFQAQYMVINESIIDGKGFPTHSTKQKCKYLRMECLQAFLRLARS